MTDTCAIDALVPVKPLAHGKGRLGGMLSAELRRRLVLAMLEDVLAALAASAVVQTTYVTSSDHEVLGLAERCRAVPLAEPAGLGGLNAALEWARAQAIARSNPCALLVMPADLPGVTGEDIALFAGDAPVERSLRICQSQDRGTNALLLCPPDAIPFAFGPLSSAAHATLATQHGITVEQREAPGLRFDIDSPEDLRTRIGQVRGPATLHLLATTE